MKNPIRNLLDQTESLKSTLAGLVEPSEYTEMRFRSYALYFLNSNKIYARLELDWWDKVDFRNCADRWLKRLCCRYAHGDQCGSEKYISLKGNIDRAGDDFLANFRKGDFIKRSEHASFDMNRKGITLHISLEADMKDSLLSQQFLEARDGITSLIPKSEGVVQSYDSEKTPMFFVECVKILREELGIKDVKVYYSA